VLSAAWRTADISHRTKLVDVRMQDDLESVGAACVGGGAAQCVGDDG